MWPTPCTTDAKNVPYQKGKDGKRYPMLLGAVRPEKMWPTPTTRDWKDGCSIGKAPVNCLLGRAGEPSPVNGALNPTWVEWLMGYPLEWTACEGWATRSSRKSPGGSPTASSKRKRAEKKEPSHDLSLLPDARA
jgi:hypothetical protein